MKTVLITGASRGIGRATATKFLQEGHNVIGTYRTGAPPIRHENFNAVQLDLASPDSINEAYQEVVNISSFVDVLINNAGILLDWNDSEIDIQKLRDTFEVNVFGLADFSEHMLPYISEGGHIVNVSSMAASLENPEDWNMMPTYKISKCALNMYTKTLGARLKDKHITVSSIDPGWVKTDMSGPEAPRKPEAAAQDIYNLVQEPRETGKFWLNGKQRSW